jgi:site-specific DNA-methyltransferase (adenine-specific)
LEEKAERNRTLVISDGNKDQLKSKLLRPQDIGKWSEESLANKTLCADLFAVMDRLPKDFADLIILDPPYNLTKDFNGKKFKARSNIEYLEYLRSWFPAIVRSLKPNGSLYLCGDWKSSSALQTVMEEHLIILNRITWQRDKGRGAKANWKNGMEDIWFAVKDPKNYHFDLEAVKMKRKVMAPYKENGVPKDWEQSNEGNFRLTHPSNFWDDITVPYWSMPENTDHPTQKPEKLVAKLILASSKPGDLVFDPFLGSGTSSVVAKKLGRRYLGIEQNEEYALLAEARLEMADSNRIIQGYTEGVFWERNTLGAQKKLVKKK